MSALSRIKKAGFEIVLHGEAGDKFEVFPASKLTMQQREFLKSHKAEIINELKIAELKAEQVTNEILGKFVTCYTPNGKPIEVEARDEEHAEFLRRWNPLHKPN